MFLRIGLACLGAVVVAWFAVLLRDTHYLDAGTASPQGGLAADYAQLRNSVKLTERIGLLRDARLFNPDTSPDLAIATGYQIHGGGRSLARAVGIVESVLTREPSNLQAWAELASIQHARHDAAGQQQALAHAARLDPVDFSGS